MRTRADDDAIRLAPFDPATASPTAWKRYHAFRAARHAEREPDEPLTSDAVVEEQMKIESPTWFEDRYVVELDDRFVGYCSFDAPRPDTPEYPSNKHLIYASGGVIAPYRRRGIGTSMLREALRALDRRGARVLTTWTCEPDGLAFASWCGARATQVERLSRLDLTSVDWAQVARWVDELSSRAPGTRLETYTDRIPQSFYAEYLPARTELMNLMPWDDTDHGDIVITAEDFDVMYERLAISRTEHHTIIAREPDGTISAITDVAWKPEHPGEVSQWFTGVHPDFRGRGLGKAIKAAMLLLLDQRYDDLRWMRTGNATTNAAMLAINERLGFEEYRRYTTYQLERDDLASFLDGLRLDS